MKKTVLLTFLFIQTLCSYSETRFIAINFKANSTDTVSCKGESSTISQIQELAKMLVDNPNVVLMISGHADINEHRKKRLSRKRAQFVKYILVTQFNIDSKRLKTEEFSDKRILISETDNRCLENKEECRCVNRRVVFYVISINNAPK